MNSTPHGIVGGTLDAVIFGVEGVGHQVMSALDSPLSQVGVPTPGPHNVAGRLANGGASAVKSLGHGVVSALNVPAEAVGIPPDIGRGLGGFSPKRFSPRMMGGFPRSRYW